MSDNNTESVQVQDYSADPGAVPDADEVLQNVQVFYEAGQFKQAQRLLKGLVQREPDNVDALLDLGIVCHRLNELEPAREFFVRLTEIDPLNSVGYYNLGHTCIMLGDLDMAFAAFSKTVELDPENARACNNLGVILERMGDYDQAIDYFVEAGELDEDHALSRLHLLKLLMAVHRLEEAGEVIEETLNLNDITSDQRGDMLATRALIAWLQGEVDVCHRVLRLCKHVVPHMQHPARYAEPIASLLIDLLEYRIQHPELYEQADREVFYIGNEQCLPSTDVVLEFDEVTYAMIPSLVENGKLADLLAEEPNAGKNGLEAAVDNVPRKSWVMFGFGDLDCDPASGMLEQIRKSKDDMDTVLQGMACSYVEYLVRLCKPKQIRIIVVGIAASNLDLQELSSTEQHQLMYMIEQLNEFLAEAILEAGGAFLDVFTATVGENGRSNKLHHMNERYLKPDALVEIARQYLLVK